MNDLLNAAIKQRRAAIDAETLPLKKEIEQLTKELESVRSIANEAQKQLSEMTKKWEDLEHIAEEQEARIDELLTGIHCNED